MGKNNADIFLDKLYKIRFTDKELEQKNKIWKVLCESFLQRFIADDDAVLDIGSGHGDFINNIRCKQKYAVDTNSENIKYLSAGVKFFAGHHANLDFLPDESVDLIFMSNFAEHLKNKDELLGLLFGARRILKNGGRIIFLGPNMKYVYRVYWDFFDHYIPLSDRAIAELFKAMDFRIVKAIPKFLPYTTKSRLPKNPFWVWLYLKIPFLWQLIGKQMFILAEKL